MIIIDEMVALRILSTMIDANTDPKVEPPELQDLLDQSKVASIWTASTTYAFGSIVQPTAAKFNGHKFKLVKFDGVGTSSGATEPTWTDSRDGEFNDGNLTWKEDGAALDSLWDLTLAAHKGWLLKAGKAAACTDFKQDDLSFSSSQVHEQCMEQAARYRPALVA